LQPAVTHTHTTTCLLTKNLREYSAPDTLPFEEKAIRWY
jgi:hypothetical protein